MQDEDALRHMVRDQTIRYHACVLAEACLRLGRWREFLEFMDRYDSVLMDSDLWQDSEQAQAQKVYP